MSKSRNFSLSLFHKNVSFFYTMRDSHQKIFRQINSLEISLVITLLSRNFCQKCETKLQLYSQCGSLRNFPPSFFCKYFAKISWNWSVKKYRMKMVLENRNFRPFCVQLRGYVLNKSYKGGFLLLETIETSGSGASGGVSGFINVWNLLSSNAIYLALTAPT